MSELLAPQFLAELEALRRHLRLGVQSGAAGVHGARRGGSSAEFLDHREYVSGDDARRIDWSAYARSRNLVIKRFRAEEDALVRIVLDASTSMAFGEPSKFYTAQRLAAAVGYLALAIGERVQLQRLGDGAPPPAAALRGQAARAGWLRQLAAIGPRGEANAPHALARLADSAKQRMVVVVVSDFLEDAITPALKRLAARGHTVHLAQILSDAELHPDLHGDLLLRDAETGEELLFSADGQSLSDYHTALNALQNELREAARMARGQFVSVPAGAPLRDPITRLLAPERAA